MRFVYGNICAREDWIKRPLAKLCFLSRLWNQNLISTDEYLHVEMLIMLRRVLLFYKLLRSSKTSAPMEPKESCTEATYRIFILILSAPIKRHLRLPYLDMNSGQKRRSRRSVSTEKNVEILMVADKTMHEFYKDGLEEYLLTIANMVCC